MATQYRIISVREIHRHGIAGSKLMCIGNFNKYYQIILYKGCYNLHYYQKCLRVPIPPHPHQNCEFPYFVIFANVIGKKRFFNEVLFCISIRKVEHLFMCWILSILAFVHTMRSYLLPIFNKSWTFYYSFVVALCTLEKLILSII